MTVRSGQLPWWFGIPFLIGAVFVFGPGIVLLQEELRYGREGVAVTGTVVDTIYHPGGGDNGPSYAIRFQFVDPATGISQSGESDVDEGVYDTAAAGDPIEVTYLPAEPTKSRIGRPEPQLLFPAIVLGAAVLFGVVGVGMLALTRWLRNNAAPSWLHVSTGISEREPDADPMPLIISNFDDAGPAAAAASAAQPPPARPTTEEELRALDARLAPPPESR